MEKVGRGGGGAGELGLTHFLSKAVKVFQLVRLCGPFVSFCSLVSLCSCLLTL